MGRTPPRLSPLLAVERLAYHANGRVIPHGVDLAVGEREIHALLGANGTGKTTLARILMGCTGYVPAAGTVRFAGRDLAGLPMRERARLGISMAWQEPVRFEGVCVEEYLSLQPSDIPPAECLRRVGLDPAAFLSRALDKTLSDGERKRIEPASMIAQRPRLALLDEPAAGIDMSSLEEIEAVIAGLRDPGGSLLLITHLEPVARMRVRGRLHYREESDVTCEATTAAPAWGADTLPAFPHTCACITPQRICCRSRG